MANTRFYETVELELTDTIPCNGPEDIARWNPELHRALGIADKDPSNPIQSDGSGNPYYASFTCVDGKLHAVCGYSFSANDDVSNKLAVANFVNNYGTTETSYCTPIENNCNILTEGKSIWRQKVPICHDSSDPPKQFWASNDRRLPMTTTLRGTFEGCNTDSERLAAMNKKFETH